MHKLRITTWLAGKFILHQLHWGSAYLLAFLVALVIILITWFSSFPSTSRRESRQFDGGAGKYWPMEIFLVGAAILVYLTGFVTIYSWIPNFTQARFSLDADMAGGLVSRLFLGMFIGQLIMFCLALKLAPALSAVIVEKYDMIAALQFTSICYCLMIVLLFGAYLLRRRAAKAGNVVTELAF